MNNKWSSMLFSNCTRPRPIAVLCVSAAIGLFAATAARADVPAWMRSAASRAIPTYPDKTEAVILYDETTIVVKDAGEVHSIHRRVYRILGTSGRDRGIFAVSFDKDTKIISMKAWSLPAGGGREYEVKEKDAIETQLTEGELYSDVRRRILNIPATEPGATIAYEIEQRERPYILQDTWWFQSSDPVLQSRFILQLPAGWRYKSSWIHHDAAAAQEDSNDQIHWDLANIPAVEKETDMPPAESIEGRMVVNYIPPTDGAENAMDTWQDIGKWYFSLANERRISSPEIKQEVTALTKGSTDVLDKIRALTQFVQKDIRYVAIEIGIGGFQPHSAASVFSDRYGDCKDKATLLASMLHEIGIDSYYVLVNTQRGVIAPDFPPGLNFDHVILAISLPANVNSPDLYAVINDPRYGRILLFDPTSTLTPLGYLPSIEQENYGMLAADDGGELLRMPLLPGTANRLERTAHLTLSADGSLTGKVEEIRSGDPAEESRARLIAAQREDRAKVLENFLGSFMGGFTLTKASVGNLQVYDKLFVMDYEFIAPGYAQKAGDLLILRPRILGAKGSIILESEKRKYPVEFDTATLQTDEFYFTLPPGYVPDELPPPTNVVYDFGSYSSKVEMMDSKTLRYSRTYRLKDVVVPSTRLGDLKQFFHQIRVDESSAAVFKKGGSLPPLGK